MLRRIDSIWGLPPKPIFQPGKTLLVDYGTWSFLADWSLPVGLLLIGLTVIDYNAKSILVRKMWGEGVYVVLALPRQGNVQS